MTYSWFAFYSVLHLTYFHSNLSFSFYFGNDEKKPQAAIEF